jgi:hypothetical protein
VGDLNERDPREGVAKYADAIAPVRIWVADVKDHVSCSIGGFDKSEEPANSGMNAADIVKHRVRRMLLDKPTRSQAQLMAEVELAFARRLKSNVTISGQIAGAIN